MRTARTTRIILALTGLLVAGCALGPLPDGTVSQPEQRSQPARATERVSVSLHAMLELGLLTMMVLGLVVALVLLRKRSTLAAADRA